MWLDVLDYIAEALRAKQVAEHVIIGGVNPTQAEIDSCGAVILMRGEETPGDERVAGGFTVTFYLEAWIRDDSPDIRQGYECLRKLEMRVDDVLTQIRADVGMLKNSMLNDTYQLVDLRVNQKVGDADSLRPLVGVQYTLTATIYDVTNEEGVW